MFAPLAALLLTASPVSHARRHVDRDAMNEAIEAADADDDYASAAAYAHFLASRVAHNAGDHRGAISELRLALASDDGEPYLLTALAEEYARAMELGRAKRILSDVVQARPAYFPAQLLLGRVLYELHEPARALTHLRRAAALRPDQSDPYLLQAEIALEANQSDRAMAAADAMWDRARDPSGLEKLGGALAERGDLVRARRLFRRATEVDPDDADAWTALAQIEEAQGNDAQAEADFANALEHDPDNRDALLSGGRAALRLGAPEHARADFDRLLSLASDPETFLKVGFSYLAANRVEEAMRVLDEGLRDGDEPRLAFYAGLLHERSGQFRRAADAFARVAEDAELGRDALLHRSRCLSRLGHLDQAEALLSAASGRHPDDTSLLSAWAGAVELLGHPERAEQLLRDGIARQPSAALYGALAELLQRHGGGAEAVEVLTAALAKAPKDADLAFALGAAYEREGDHPRALAQMREVLKIDPKNASAMNFIGYTLTERGEGLDEAQRLLERALALKPDSGAFLDSLGWLYFRKGEFTRAAGTLEKAAALAPDEPVILEHLGDAYAKLQQDGLASAAYRKALDALRGAADDAQTHALKDVLARKLKSLSTEAARR